MAEARAEGIIPQTFPTSPAGRDSIDKFLKYHFVQGDVIFDDGKLSGRFDTHFTYRDPNNQCRILNQQIKVINAPQNLVLEKMCTGQVVNVTTQCQYFMVRKGVLHKINSVLNLNYYK
jgi:uncharacterized surface protein with fasciclin (FAS1) repeats